LNEETIGNETDNVMLVPGLKDEIQTSLELKVSVFYTLTPLGVGSA